MTEIPIEVRSAYGTDRLYATGPLAEPIEWLTGTRSLNHHHIEALRELGFECTLPDGTRPYAAGRPEISLWGGEME